MRFIAELITAVYSQSEPLMCTYHKWLALSPNKEMTMFRKVPLYFDT